MPQTVEISIKVYARGKSDCKQGCLVLWYMQTCKGDCWMWFMPLRPFFGKALPVFMINISENTILLIWSLHCIYIFKPAILLHLFYNVRSFMIFYIFLRDFLKNILYNLYNRQTIQHGSSYLKKKLFYTRKYKKLLISVKQLKRFCMLNSLYILFFYTVISQKVKDGICGFPSHCFIFTTIL